MATVHLHQPIAKTSRSILRLEFVSSFPEVNICVLILFNSKLFFWCLVSSLKNEGFFTAFKLKTIF